MKIFILNTSRRRVNQMKAEDTKELKSQIKDSYKILLANLDQIDKEISNIKGALKREGIKQANIDLSFLSLYNYLNEQDKLLRSLAGIRKRKKPLGNDGN
jgi:hypothetical protein